MEHKNRPPEWYSHNVPPEHHHPHNEWLVDRCSDQCDDQLPLFSRVGRGLQGNGYKVEVEQPSDCETYLHGYIYDSATGTYISDWQSHNVNGGHLSYQYHLHPYGDPPTFTITFKYDRPCYDDEHDMSWEWTTPAIPYIAEASGSGIGNLFIKPVTSPSWEAVRAAVASSDLPDSIADTLAAYEKLVFPEGDTRESLNPPLPGDDWTVNLTYGKNGDINCPTTAEAAADDAATLAAAKQYTDDSIPSIAEGNGIKVTKNGTEYIVSTDLKAGSNVNLATDPNTGQITISSTDTNTVTTVARGNGILVVDNGSGGNHAYTVSANLAEGSNIDIGTNPNTGQITISADLSGIEGDVIEKIIAPKMTTKSVSGRIAFYDLRKKTDNTTDSPQKGAEAKGDRMIPNRLTTLQGGLQSITATAKISYFDTVPNVYITLEIDDTSGNDHSMFPSQVGVFEVNVSNSWVPLDITIAQTIGGISLPGLPYPKLQAETLCNTGYFPPSTSPSNTGNFQVYTGIGNIKAAKKNINGSDEDERSYGGWPWAEAAASNSPAYIYLINRYVAYGDEECCVSIDYARDYHTSYLRTGSNN